MYEIFLALFGFVSLASSAPTTNPTATIADGLVIGTVTSLPTGSNTVHKYLGIPLAVSPPLRFAPPEDPAPWSEPLVAQHFKPACIQQFNYPKQFHDRYEAFQNDPPIAESEDCLYINVFAPAAAPPPDGRTVMVWIYGGTLQTGGSNWHPYDGTSFAANQDIVLVTFNYRTGPFGFSNSPEIPFGQQNSGFLDQRKALEWVQQNIVAFGGDPNKVTIFGESAGALSTKQLLTLPPEAIPFRAAIVESFPAYGSNGSTAWDALVEKSNCSDAVSPIECVRALPASTINSISEHHILDFNPAGDNVTFAIDARPYFNEGKAANVPIMLGSNADEGSVFAYFAGQDDPSINVTKTVQEYYPGQIKQQQAVLKVYSDYLDDPYRFFTRYDGDTSFQCPLAAFTDLLVDNDYTAWRYYYNASFLNLHNRFPRSGVYHYSEVPMVFGTYPTTNATKEEKELSRYMQTTWADFAKDPDCGPGWTKLGGSEKDMEVIGGGLNNIRRRIAPKNVADGVCRIYPSIMEGPL